MATAVAFPSVFLPRRGYVNALRGMISSSFQFPIGQNSSQLMYPLRVNSSLAKRTADNMMWNLYDQCMLTDLKLIFENDGAHFTRVCVNMYRLVWTLRLSSPLIIRLLDALHTIHESCNNYTWHYKQAMRQPSLDSTDYGGIPRGAYPAMSIIIIGGVRIACVRVCVCVCMYV